MRRFFCITFIFIFLAVSSFGQLHLYVYAEQQPAPGDNWTQVPTDQQYLAFKAYMRARDITLSGSAAGALSTFTSDLYQNLIKTTGLDMNTIQAGIFGVYQNNQWLRFGFSALGINAFNMLCAQFLQDYSINVGDENVDKVLKSGKWFQDEDGYGCWVYILNTANSYSSTIQKSTESDLYSAVGSTYRYASANMSAYYTTGYTSPTFNFTPTQSGYFTFTHSYNSNWESDLLNVSCSLSSYNPLFYRSNGKYPKKITEGVISIFYYSGNYYIGDYWKQVDSNLYTYNQLVKLDFSNGTSPTDTTVDVTSPKVKAPIDPPSGDDITVIEPDGNIPEPEPEPEPPGGTIPDWNIPNSTITGDSGTGDYNIDWNFQLPDLNIDWSINGLTEKFPFSIPFDIVRLVSVLSAEPEAPHIESTVDLMIYQWEVDIDLSDFDTVAAILRNMLFILFCIGLIVVTRSIIRG